MKRVLRVILGIILAGILGLWIYGQRGGRINIEATPEPAHETEEAVQMPEATPETTPEPTTEPTPDPTEKPVRFDTDSWQYMLVNADNSIGQYEPEELAYINIVADDTEIRTEFDPNRQVVDIRIAQPLLDMAMACKEAGFPIYLSSGYRSYETQAENFRRVCANNGVSDGKDAAGYYITMPAGCSEHQTGLCCDITDRYYPIKDSTIENTETFKWLKEHCAEYGFVLRFPVDKADMTGVMYEPFHFRYVGVEAAQYMQENNLCLEEFVKMFKQQ